MDVRDRKKRISDMINEYREIPGEINDIEAQEIKGMYWAMSKHYFFPGTVEQGRSAHVSIPGYMLYLQTGRVLGWHKLKSSRFSIKKPMTNIFSQARLGHGLVCASGSQGQG